MLAAGTLSNGTRLWDVATGRESAMVPVEGENVREVALSRDAQTLLAVTHNGFVVHRDVPTGQTRVLLRERGAHCWAITPDARFLASADDDAVVRVWDLARRDCEIR
jgi:WD40 repeat protein